MQASSPWQRSEELGVSLWLPAGHPSSLGARNVLAYPPASGQVPWAWVGPGHVAPLSQIPLALAQHFPGWSREGRGEGRFESLWWQVIKRTCFPKSSSGPLGMGSLVQPTPSSSPGCRAGLGPVDSSQSRVKTPMKGTAGGFPLTPPRHQESVFKSP